jgi:hypothetical protein
MEKHLLRIWDGNSHATVHATSGSIDVDQEYNSMMHDSDYLHRSYMNRSNSSDSSQDSMEENRSMNILGCDSISSSNGGSPSKTSPLSSKLDSYSHHSALTQLRTCQSASTSSIPCSINSTPSPLDSYFDTNSSVSLMQDSVQELHGQSIMDACSLSLDMMNSLEKVDFLLLACILEQGYRTAHEQQQPCTFLHVLLSFAQIMKQLQTHLASQIQSSKSYDASFCHSSKVKTTTTDKKTNGNATANLRSDAEMNSNTIHSFESSNSNSVTVKSYLVGGAKDNIIYRTLIKLKQLQQINIECEANSNQHSVDHSLKDHDNDNSHQALTKQNGAVEHEIVAVGDWFTQLSLLEENVSIFKYRKLRIATSNAKQPDDITCPCDNPIHLPPPLEPVFRPVFHLPPAPRLAFKPFLNSDYFQSSDSVSSLDDETPFSASEIALNNHDSKNQDIFKSVNHDNFNIRELITRKIFPCNDVGLLANTSSPKAITQPIIAAQQAEMKVYLKYLELWHAEYLKNKGYGCSGDVILEDTLIVFCMQSMISCNQNEQYQQQSPVDANLDDDVDRRQCNRMVQLAQHQQV